MSQVGVRAPKQNASAVVAEAASGELITITDRGRPVAQLGPVRQFRLEVCSSPDRRGLPSGGWRISVCRKPVRGLSVELQTMRDAERY